VGVAPLFGLASFLCSALIFWIEPLVGKELLPLVGGAPAVWNICLLFFQIALLAGYAVAHSLTKVRSGRAQAGIYLVIAAASFALLPVHFDTAPGDPSHPAAWLMRQLLTGLLFPFVSLAVAAPLLQHWYSRTREAAARDPYFLYAASNAGSLLALLAVPFIIEPRLQLHQQNVVWTWMFVVAAILCLATSFAARPPAGEPDATSRLYVTSAVEPESARPDVRTFMMWALLAAVPSSLLMGVTTYLTGDIAPVPLLWIVPLAVYLLTFIAAFGPLRSGAPTWFHRVTVIAAVTWCTLYKLQATDPLWLLVVIHLSVFGILALGAHARLAASRPAPSQLTSFYLAIAVGGACGGAFNAILAPALFNSYMEYPLVVLAAVLLDLRGRDEPPGRARDALGILALAVILMIAFAIRIHAGALQSIFVVGIPSVVAYMLSGRRIRFVAALALVLITPRFDLALQGFVLHSERNFYGVLRVTTDANNRFHELRHGNTLHGASDMSQPGGSDPRMYYWTGSPVADAIRSMQSRRDSLNVSVVGLGVGTLAWYARQGEVWTFYEINPAVIRIAEDTASFTYLARSKADSIVIVPGDARFQLSHAIDGSQDVIVLDAFTSDAIPVHLLTLEALRSYARKLKPDGVLVFHISNRYLDLAPVIAAGGKALGLRTWMRQVHVTDTQRQDRLESSDWLVLARSTSDLDALGSGRWRLVSAGGRRVWTDDYSDLWSAFAR
jgi:SAM-dependent methyltransferase